MKLAPTLHHALAVLFCLAAAAPAQLEAQALFDLGTATAAPGQTDATLPLSIQLEPGSFAVQGWVASVHYDPSVLRKLIIENTRPADFFFYRAADTFAEPGTVAAAVVYSFEEDESRYVAQDNDGVVATLTLCVQEDAPAGTYPIDFDLEAEGSDGWSSISMSYTADGQSFHPRTQAGSVTITGSPVLGGECPPDPEGYTETPGSLPPDGQLEGTYKLLGGQAAPGVLVAVPFIINSNLETEGFSISIDFDEDVLEATAIDTVYEKPDGTDWDFQVFEFDNSRDASGNAGVDEGYVVGAAVFDVHRTGPELLPPRDTDAEILSLHFRVRVGATLGETCLSFVDGARVPSVGSNATPVENALTLGGQSAIPRFDVTPIVVDAVLRIIPDISIFIRGDSNGDRNVDVSDAQTTLGYLFLGSEPPVCLDAADANDDGGINISDPIATLQFLFLGGEALPPPSSKAGMDRTIDSLDCLVTLSG